ncbi:hypothetical protein BDB00DRAFT_851400 [Zychaea mexicana]|uniref:uncharacterized protein n=1 Tax=Zychaea mexicana TaxID=64656 RepID=UPI0022FEDE05|nr:uncharacterized protein BDB00DRAFT_851400 [Zychaea mexicana]KAI9485081.1 hypothetical protein BDB00DRAFT_851400 [Zychaea mexicana]
MSCLLHNLPSEIIWQIVSYLSLKDLTTARLASMKLRHFCDHPSHWKNIRLEPPRKAATTTTTDDKNSNTKPSSMPLWQINDLEHILEPHLKHIQSIRIWGVRDNIVRYLLQHCVNLNDLTICGWTTLSNHAFKTSRTRLALRRLELIGADQQPNYAAIDARLLGDLLTQCPDLSELMLGCQVHIHARTLLIELRKRKNSTSNTTQQHRQQLPPLQLRSLTLATRRTWSQRHVAELLDLCPHLERVSLFLAAAKGFDLKKSEDIHQLMMADKPQEVSLEPNSDGEEDDAQDNVVGMAHDMVIFRRLSS